MKDRETSSLLLNVGNILYYIMYVAVHESIEQSIIKEI